MVVAFNPRSSPRPQVFGHWPDTRWDLMVAGKRNLRAYLIYTASQATRERLLGVGVAEAAEVLLLITAKPPKRLVVAWSLTPWKEGGVQLEFT